MAERKKLRHWFGTMEETACGTPMRKVHAGGVASLVPDVTCPGCQRSEEYQAAARRIGAPVSRQKGTRVRRSRVPVLAPGCAERLLKQLIDNGGAIKAQLLARGVSERSYHEVCAAVRALAEGTEVSDG
ncbi:hypothetical protein [Hyalangium versicolor]|uniref:hypothetical protein n=1 Tax=Hyalangium versicolor TaxID=2861190 RepID=UPI001CCD08B0|nr:hypothetical protein [Hyalangium versicolor]